MQSPSPESREREAALPDSSAFAWICRQIEADTRLDRLESRGTVRIALKSAGLEAASVLPAQMSVVIERLLPRELGARGVDGVEALCARWTREVEHIEAAADPVDSPDEVFRRLGS